MKLSHKLALLSGLLLSGLTGGSAFGQTLIIRDNYTAASNLTGYAMGEGANAGINVPTSTRLTGSAASGLSYTNLAPRLNVFITSNRLRFNQGLQGGRFVLANDSVPFDFGVPLGVASATPSNPIEYDVTISMDNNASTARLSFGFATVTNDVGFWDFGVQIAKSTNGPNYKVYKRIDSASRSSGGDLNAEILSAPALANGSEVDFLMRVTDAGAETTTLSSRVRLSVDGGTNWFYDTDTDADLAGTKIRFDGAARYFIGDIPANNDGFVTYDNFSITLNSSTSTAPVLSTPTGTPGNLTINFTGTPGTTYTIQRAATLPGTWEPLGTATTDGSSGAGSYTDLVNHGAENSFYRVVFP